LAGPPAFENVALPSTYRGTFFCLNKTARNHYLTQVEKDRQKAHLFRMRHALKTTLLSLAPLTWREKLHSENIIKGYSSDERNDG
jgi:hypothetical protein